MVDKEKQVAENAGFDGTSVEPGVWRYARASRARLVIDGEDYFELIQQAMLEAQKRILLIGWDFDTRIHLSKGRRWWQKGWKREYPRRLGSFILWLVRHRQTPEIRILKWSYGVVRFAGRGSMAIDLLRWIPHKRIDFKFDTAHPVGCCHHQKIVVIDNKFAVCGGIDMTTRRWDTRDHHEFDDRRRGPNGAHQDPWHDMAMLMEGEIAETLGELGRSRWVRAGGTPLEKYETPGESAWPKGLEAHFEDVEIGIARSMAAYGDDPDINEVEELFLRQIASAKHFIYAENQYFASRTVGEAIAKRLAEDDPPEIVIVHPKTADGWVESKAMDPARAQIVSALREIDHKERFHIYVPHAGQTPIYVHAKLMIVDDRILRVGSSNFNNRSFGLDSECDIFIDCDRPGNESATDQIRKLRLSLLAEHLSLGEIEVDSMLREAGSMSALIARVANSRRRWLEPFHPLPISDLEAALAERETFDPEEPAAMFQMVPPSRGLFRPGSLLTRAARRIKKKASRK